jgi:ATP-dependent helicase HrpB
MIPPSQLQLPIDALLPEILSRLKSHPTLILCASPGSGKTTRVPPALLAEEGEVWVLEPRRIAARLSSERVAAERGEKVGQTVGYLYRFENQTSEKTRLKFLTEGTFLRLLSKNPRLQGVQSVVLDEFHERHLQTDLALALITQLKKTVRPDLKLLVMSATLGVEELEAFFRRHGIVSHTLSLHAPLHPVEIHFEADPVSPRNLESVISTLLLEEVLRDWGKTPGHVLVFLPGMSEIRRVQALLEQESRLLQQRGILLAPLHGDLPQAQQRLALDPSRQKKVILSTNIAESSITLEGVNWVIDSGYHRQMSFSHGSGQSRLATRRISRASSIQRAGRAGRIGPGQCHRIYTEFEYQSAPAFDLPEIARTELTAPLLDLKGMSEQLSALEDPTQLPWLQAPDSLRLEAAAKLLYQIGLLDAPRVQASLTPLGRRANELPLHPRLARVLLAFEKVGRLEVGFVFCSLLTEGLVEPRSPTGAQRKQNSIPDTESMLWESLERGRSRPSLLEDRLRHHFKKTRPSIESETKNLQEQNALGALFLSGFPDRVCVHARDSLFFTSAGGSFEIALEHPENIGAFLLIDAQESVKSGHSPGSAKREELRVLQAIGVSLDSTLGHEPDLLKEERRLRYERASKQVLASETLQFLELPLSTQDRAEPPESAESDPELKTQILTLLFKEGLGIDLKRLENEPLAIVLQEFEQKSREFSEGLQEGLRRLELALPEVYQTLTAASPGQGQSLHFLKQLLSALLDSQHMLTGPLQKLATLVSTRLIDHLFSARLDSRQLSQLDQFAPTHLQLASGRKVRVNYPANSSPWCESRLQDFFGLREAPKIGKGTLPLVIHLLAPNRRPVQVTSDLASFWKNTYPTLRRELSRNYPRHSWPEDPFKIPPTGSKP